MEMRDVLEKPLVAGRGEMVSRVASRMIAERKHEAIILDGEDLAGIVLARDLVKKRISEPHKTKIDSFIVEESPLLPGTDASEVVNTFLVNDYRTVPVKDNGKIMLLTKISLLRLVKGNPALKGKSAGDVMKFPYCISLEDSLSTARAIIKDMNISRLPVVNGNKVEGVVDTLDLLGPLVSGELDKRGEPQDERTHIDQVPASSFMRKNIPRMEASAELRKVIDLMVDTQSAVIVERDGKLLGIVTPGDVLKLLGKEVKGAYVTISGLREEDDFAKDLLYKEIESSLKKINRIYPVNYFVAHMDKYNEAGSRVKYSFRVRLATEKGFFFAQDYDWDVAKAIKGVLDKLEKEVTKKKEKQVY